MILALLLGGCLGLLNGWLARVSLIWAVDRSDKLFYGLWAAGFIYRFLFAAAFIVLLLKYPVVPFLPATLALIAGQFVLQVIPIREKS
ncbi:MAG: hypothetical protein HY400_02120 [Elusimicrobia bacterium]|nr:hypothetical protein [Elusimicrobiota bacterium]